MFNIFELKEIEMELKKSAYALYATDWAGNEKILAAMKDRVLTAAHKYGEFLEKHGLVSAQASLRSE